MPSTIHSRNTTALVCLLAHKAFVKAKCFAHATRYEGECNELVLPDIRGQHICFGSYGKLQDCPLRHLFSCVFACARGRRQNRNRHRHRYRQLSQKEWGKRDHPLSLCFQQAGAKHTMCDVCAMYVHAHTRPHAHALMREGAASKRYQFQSTFA